uniref:Reverse transcriptase domain-containing protein n=1 Tax=Tanacetum cinerariifolium TaxID=118510 RepID=A0A6L2JE18_TANCI|nr:reverse transcriptase domain-containing protein [Tanacetum cinerariifolium]
MQTRSSSRLVSNPSSNPTPSRNPNPKGRNRGRSKQRIEEFNLDELSPPVVMMADQRTMAQLLQAPTEGYEDAIVVPAITADNFELKHARIWLEKEPSRSIFTWDDLVSKFINQFFPPSKTTNLRNEITNFQQHFDESFSEAWDRFKDLLRACPHYVNCEGLRNEFLNIVTINVAIGGWTVSDMVKALILDEKSQNQAPATVKAVKESSPGYQALARQTQGVLKEDFSAYVKANDAVMRNMHTQEATKDTVHPTNNGSTEDVQPRVVQSETPILTSKLVNSPIIEPVASPAECLALADLGASINLMPLYVWNKLSLLDLTPTCMTLELADRLFLIRLGLQKMSTSKSFLKTGRALIDVFECELTLRVGKEAITFNLDQTSRYSANYNDMTAKQTDVIDMACKEYSQEVLGFSYVIATGNPTPYYDPIVSTTSPTLTPFGNSDFLFEEVDAFLALEDDPTSSEELKIYEAKFDKSSIDEPPEVELKDLPPHFEYAFLEGDDKLPVIIMKDLSVEEKTALITVLKSHKRAITWKLFDIKGIDPEFCTNKILMEEDFEPAVQHQRRVNLKIYDVIKQEVLKLLDVGLIYPISNSPWVSPIHCVPKKGGFTIVENEDNELILTRLVTGWRVCIDYRKLNEATRKDHFLLPFMDQMLERLVGNQYYCFLDGFSGYFQIPINLKD